MLAEPFPAVRFCAHVHSKGIRVLLLHARALRLGTWRSAAGGARGKNTECYQWNAFEQLSRADDVLYCTSVDNTTVQAAQHTLSSIRSECDCE